MHTLERAVPREIVIDHLSEFLVRRANNIVSTIDESRVAAQQRDAQLPTGNDLAQLARASERNELPPYLEQRLAVMKENGNSFFLQAAAWWEGKGLYFALGKEVNKLHFSKENNQHYWASTPKAIRFDMPRVQKNTLSLERTTYDEYGRSYTQTVDTVSILSTDRVSMHALLAENRHLSKELFGVKRLRLPTTLVQSSWELPRRKGVPSPISYRPQFSLFSTSPYVSSYVFTPNP